MLGDVQNAVACVWYHRDNLCAIEAAVRRIFVGSGAQAVLGNSTIGTGNTIRWDAEYQAFVLSVRRCLDYLARALSAYFQQECHSFRRLPQLLARVKPTSVSSAIATAQQRHAPHFAYVLSGEKKSIRDLLSHYKYIEAGSLNLSRHGFLMAGGAENLRPPVGQAWEGGLSAVIAKRADDLHACVVDLLTSFVTAVEQHERTFYQRR